MRKHTLLRFVASFALVGLLFLSGCSANSKGYSDDAFISALETGLVNRWKISDKDDSKEAYRKAINAELDQVSQFEDKKFKNSELKEYAIAYINSLKKQKATLKYWSADDFDAKWDKVYDERTAALVKINKIHKLKVSEKEDSLEELLGNGKSVNEKANINKKIDAMLSKAKVERIDDDGSTEVEVTLTNTTGKDFKNFQVILKLQDDDNATVATDYLNTADFTNGSTVKLKGYPDADSWSKYTLTRDVYDLDD